MHRLKVLAVVAAAFLESNAPAILATNACIGDAEIRGPDAYYGSVYNYGGNTDCYVFTPTSALSPRKRGLVKFDITAVQKRVNRATLTAANRSAGTTQFIVYRGTRNWVEGTGLGQNVPGVSWKKYDGTNAWTVSGSDYDTSFAVTSAVLAVNQDLSLDVTALVQKMADASQTYASFTVFCTTDGTTGGRFLCKEYAGQPRPTLIVDSAAPVPQGTVLLLK